MPTFTHHRKPGETQRKETVSKGFKKGRRGGRLHPPLREKRLKVAVWRKECGKFHLSCEAKRRLSGKESGCGGIHRSPYWWGSGDDARSKSNRGEGNGEQSGIFNSCEVATQENEENSEKLKGGKSIAILRGSALGRQKKNSGVGYLRWVSPQNKERG